jgi:hypothetical protein
MKTDLILQELEVVKERLAEAAGGNTQRFLDQMDAWLMEHPHAGPVVNWPEDLQARLRAREAAAPLPRSEPYRVFDTILAELHRLRAAQHCDNHAGVLVLKDEAPPKKD